MSDQLQSIQRMLKKMEGDGPIEKHILLLKLTEALENKPDFSGKPAHETTTPQRQWISQVSALLNRLSIRHSVRLQTSFGMLPQYWQWATSQIVGQVLDAIEVRPVNSNVMLKKGV